MSRAAKNDASSINGWMSNLERLVASGADSTVVHATVADAMRRAGAANVAAGLLGLWLRARAQTEQLLAVLEGLKSHAEQCPRLMRVVSPVLALEKNGQVRQVVYLAPVGRPGELRVACLLDPQMQPAPMEWCLADVEGQFFLGPAPGTPPPRMLYHSRAMAASVRQESQMGELIVEDTPDRQLVLYCRPELAEEVSRLLKDGQTVVVRHDGACAEAIYDNKQPPAADWLEFPPLDGPGLDELVFPSRLAREWKKDVRRLMRGTHGFRVLLVGPTGVGKTEAVIRTGREAARRSGKRFALIRISTPHVGSCYYSETERAIARALRSARRLAAQGDTVVAVLLDEADSLVGNSEGRYEGSVDRRVRQSIQELLSEPLPGVAVYATMNPRRDSWLPAAVERRFRKRLFPRPSRSQMARVAALYAHPDALAQLSLCAQDFGSMVADYLFSNEFVVAYAWTHSGQQIAIRARDLHNCAPGKLRDLVETFCDDLLDREETDVQSLKDLWLMIESEMKSVALNENNLYELTFLSPPIRDTVRKVEMVSCT
ncbi:MAG: hypothetical protein KatS3mg109_0292 [Pirellulaceae bacterium]|nr:MAG: hypothetical protein KatS3mg109_0292 [Pirellulaceae bacterium]